jgi:hypothetical protein
MKDEAIFKVGQNGMSPGLPLGSLVTSVPMNVSGQTVLVPQAEIEAIRSEVETELNATNASLMETPATLVGSWHLELSNGFLQEVTLDLNQLEDLVFGRGQISYGNNTTEITASGSVSGSAVDLNLVPTDGMQLYSLALEAKNGTLSGSYDGFNSAGETWTGEVSGNLVA